MQPVSWLPPLVDEALSAGAYRTTWSGRDQQGGLVSSGVYFLPHAGRRVCGHAPGDLAEIALQLEVRYRGGCLPPSLRG